MRKKIEELNKAEIELDKPLHLMWAVNDVGFGQFYFYEKDGKIHCDNECMSKEFIKKVLNDMIDDCILDDE